MDQQIEEHAASVLQTLDHPLTLASIPSDSAIRSELPLSTPHDDSADRIEQDAMAHSVGMHSLGSGEFRSLSRRVARVKAQCKCQI